MSSQMEQDRAVCECGHIHKDDELHLTCKVNGEDGYCYCMKFIPTRSRVEAESKSCSICGCVLTSESCAICEVVPAVSAEEFIENEASLAQNGDPAIRKKRYKPRPGRLQDDELAAIRMACWWRDKGMCQNCGIETNILVSQESDIAYHMAHIKAKRMGGDSLENVRVECGKCHREFHQFGPSRIKPCPPK